MTPDPWFAVGYLVGFAALAVVVVGIVRLELTGIRRPERGDTITDLFLWAKARRPWVTWLVACLIMLACGFAVLGAGWLFGHWIIGAW